MGTGTRVGMAAAHGTEYFVYRLLYKKTRTLKYAQTCSSEGRTGGGLPSIQDGQMELRVAERTGELNEDRPT